jgi:porphobilinogen synthase
MNFPEFRARRLRKSETMRRLVQETRLHPSDFIYPILVSEIISAPQPIKSMPGIFNFPFKEAAKEAKRVYELGIPAVLLFGTPKVKDATGSGALRDDGLIQKTIKEIKSLRPDILVITDVCLCGYTDHGHCGIIKDKVVDNDATLELLADQAVSHARAGADMIAPSDMMDGRVAAIRKALDIEQFRDIPIMSYSAKYASAFYGPFREAVDSAPKFGDRRTYQMDPANALEAIKEISLDIGEGADIVMVKPALPCLDIIAHAKAKFDSPLASYNVSGEYSMVKLAARENLADEKQLTLEVLTAIKRAGSDIIISYHAPQVAEWI